MFRCPLKDIFYNFFIFILYVWLSNGPVVHTLGIQTLLYHMYSSARTNKHVCWQYWIMSYPIMSKYPQGLWAAALILYPSLPKWHLGIIVRMLLDVFLIILCFKTKSYNIITKPVEQNRIKKVEDLKIFSIFSICHQMKQDLSKL